MFTEKEKKKLEEKLFQIMSFFLLSFQFCSSVITIKLYWFFFGLIEHVSLWFFFFISLKIFIFLRDGKKWGNFEVYISMEKVWLGTLQRTCSSQCIKHFLFELKIDLSTSQWLDWKTTSPICKFKHFILKNHQQKPHASG